MVDNFYVVVDVVVVDDGCLEGEVVLELRVEVVFFGVYCFDECEFGGVFDVYFVVFDVVDVVCGCV